MGAGFLITRILLVFLFSEVNYSLAFPRGRRFLYPRVWQDERDEPPELSRHRNSRPLQYTQSLRVSPRSWQPNVQDQLNDKWQRPQESVIRVPSTVQPNLYQQTHSPDGPLSDPGFRRPQETPVQPRTFEFSMKIPISNILSIIKGTSLTSSSGSSVHLNEGSTKDQNGRITDFSTSVPNNPFQNPSSSNVGHLINLQIPQSAGFVQNSYMEPANPQSSSTQTGTDWTNLAGTVQQQTQQHASEQVQSKPTNNEPVAFSSGQSSQQMNPTEQTGQINLPTPQNPAFPKPDVPEPPSPNPSSSNVGHLTNLQAPQGAGFVHNIYMEPANPQLEWTSLSSAGTVQQQTQQAHTKPTNNKPAALSPGQSSQQMNPTEQTGQINFPTPQSLVFPKPGVPEISSPSLPTPNDPQHVNPYSGYTSPQINPTRSKDQTNVQLPLSPPQYEPIPSDNYNVNNYATWQSVHTPQDSCHHYMPPCDCSQKETAPHTSLSSTVGPSQYEYSTFHSREVASSASHDAVNVAPMGQNSDPSWSPYQHSSDPQGTDQHFQSPDHQTQMRLQNRRPKYVKLYIDVDEGGDGENKYFTEQTAQRDGYSGRNIARRPSKDSNSPLSKPQSWVSVRQDRLTDLLDSTYPSKRILRHYIQANPLHV